MKPANDRIEVIVPAKTVIAIANAMLMRRKGLPPGDIRNAQCIRISEELEKQCRFHRRDDLVLVQPTRDDAAEISTACLDADINLGRKFAMAASGCDTGVVRVPREPTKADLAAARLSWDEMDLEEKTEVSS